MCKFHQIRVLLGLVLCLSFGQAALAAERLVVLGDSISAGYGIESGSGWVDLFQKKLASNNIDVEVVNESISGEVTAGGLARLPGILERVQPQWLIVELGGNDGLRGLSPKVMEQNLKSTIALAKQKGIKVFLFGMKLPPNYGKQYNHLFERTFIRVDNDQQVPLLPFFLDGVGGFSQFMQSDGIHPNDQAQQILANNAWEFMAPFIHVVQTN